MTAVADLHKDRYAHGSLTIDDFMLFKTESGNVAKLLLLDKAASISASPDRNAGTNVPIAESTRNPEDMLPMSQSQIIADTFACGLIVLQILAGSFL